MEYKPFLKWAGGKRSIINQLVKYTPNEFNNYFEPFVGGGALFFYLRSHPEVYGNLDNRFTLIDSNQDLINCYTTIKECPNDVLKELINFKDLNNKQDFYKIRYMDRNGELDNKNIFYITARFIYLNRVSFNGLCRYNSKGHYNTSYGNYNNPNIYNEEIIINTSKALQTGKIIYGDFELILENEINIRANDFLYFDPPYDPISKTSNFTTYTAANFKRDDHIRLHKTINKLTEMNVMVLLSNSNTGFIKDLYKDYNIKEIKAPRIINGIIKEEVSELLIMNEPLLRNIE